MKNYLEDLTEYDHRLQYTIALEVAGVPGPAWEELTDEQRRNLRNIHLVQIRAVNDISKFIIVERNKT